MSDAALRRGIEESLTQYEFDRVNRLQLEEALRASRAQQNNGSINISTGRSTTPSVSAATIREQRLLHFRTLNYAQTNAPTAGSTTLSSTAVRIGSAISQLQTIPSIVSSSTAGQIEEGFMLQNDKCPYFLDLLIVVISIKAFQDLSNMFRKYSTVTMFS